MVKVITYGTYDLLHHGHRRLLERAKALGEYLIVGVTGDDFDKHRGKINVKQSLMERIEGVRATGLADEIIVEEYEGQKIDDIKRYGADIFTVGSDWTGKFEYLREFCQVVYLPRTEGVSSSEVRAQKCAVRIGVIGDPDSAVVRKFINECGYVNGAKIAGICSTVEQAAADLPAEITNDFEWLLTQSDAVYIAAHPKQHQVYVETALNREKHVLCEAPAALRRDDCDKWFDLARKQSLVLMEAVKTAYSTAYSRLLLLAKTGRIGRIASVDATCTSLERGGGGQARKSSMYTWGPVAMLPVFQLLGTNYTGLSISACLTDGEKQLDYFSKINLTYSNATATLKVGNGVKSEGELVISGTNGYIYVPAPWWKTDYFEIRYENPADNQRCFYQLEGEGIRHEIASFLRAIETRRQSFYIEQEISKAIAGVMEDFEQGRNVQRIIL